MVTGVGVVSALGFGRREFWGNLLAGRSGVGPVEAFDASTLGRSNAAEVRGFRSRDFLTAAESRRTGRCGAMTLAAARMAWEDSGLPDRHVSPERVSVVLGTTMGEALVIEQLDHAWIHSGREAVDDRLVTRYGAALLPINVARAFGARGVTLALPAACAAGNYAIGFASDLIRTGRADVVITGSAETLQQLQFSGFVRLGAVAPDRCQPFDLNRQGLILGEGAGVLVVESEEHAIRRGASPLAEVGGYGLACDAYHITRPHPEAEGTISAIRRALDASGIGPDDVSLVNAHGTATRANDQAEARALRDVFGARRLPVTANKSMIGHAMGAASAIEAVACIMSIVDDKCPPTMGYDTPDPECPIDVVTEATEMNVDVVLNTALAFGGYDSVQVFGKPGKLPHPRDVRRLPS